MLKPKQKRRVKKAISPYPQTPKTHASKPDYMMSSASPFRIVFYYPLQSTCVDFKLGGICNALTRRGHMRRKHHLHPPPPRLERRLSVLTTIVIVVVIRVQRRCHPPRPAVHGSFEERHAARNLRRPHKAQAWRLERMRRPGLIAPSREPALLVIQKQSRRRGRAVIRRRHRYGRCRCRLQGGRRCLLLILTSVTIADMVGARSKWAFRRRGSHRGRRYRRRRPVREPQVLLQQRSRGRREAIGDLVRHHNGNVVPARQVAEMRAETHELGAAGGHAGPHAAAGVAVKLGAKVGGDGVEHNQADIVAREEHGDLVLEDVVLRFEVRRDGAEDVVERRAAMMVIRSFLLICKCLLYSGAGGEHLRQAARCKSRFRGDVEGLLTKTAGRGQLNGEAEGEEELCLAGARLAGEFGDVADRDAAAEGRIERIIEGADA